MEEDIKILEDLIKYYEAEAISRNFRGTLSISVDEQDIQALENLLTRYKQLEEENKRLKDKETEKFLKVLEDNSKTMLVKEVMELRTELQNSIPKSKVKEKIEELNGNKKYLSKFNDWKEKDYTNEDIINNCIEVLQELLEEE